MTLPVALPTALLLLAVDPALGGLVLQGADGWALDAPAQALAALLPHDPALPPGPRVLRLPINAAPDHLLGGLDLDATLRTGRRVLRPGLLAAHDGGVLWLPDPDLLDPAAAGPLAAALHRGSVRIERDGLSATLPTRLLLLTASAGPTTAPTAPRYPALLDCAGLWLGGGDWGLEVGHEGSWIRDAGSGIADARARRPAVRIARAQIATLAAVALRLGVAGLRVDYLACRVACASAALACRAAVADDDLALAVALVLAPRATTTPPPQDAPPPPPPAQDQQTESPAPATPNGDSPGPEIGPQHPDADSSSPDSKVQNPKSKIQNPDRLIAAQAAYLPPQLLTPPAGPAARLTPRAGGGGRWAGARRLQPAPHGRPGPARAAPRRPPGASLDLAATLEAAARRLAAVAGARDQGSESAERGAEATVETTAGDSQFKIQNSKFKIRAADLRWRRPQAPAGVLFLLAVDASGSMARNRLGAAKGAALLLLERAYRHRDRVALIGMRGPQAAVLLPPTRSLARARRLLDYLPAGGGTPLASALALAGDLAGQAARAGYPHALLVLLTDGRANVPLAGPPTAEHVAAEVAALAGRWAALAAAGRAAPLVVDTRLRYLGGGAAPALAAALGGRYLYLPQATPDILRRAAETAAAGLGWRA